MNNTDQSWWARVLVKFPSYQISTLLLVATVCGCSFAFFKLSAHPVESPVPVATEGEWEHLTKKGECILAIFGNWNIEDHIIRNGTDEFAQWCDDNNFLYLTIDVSGTNLDDEQIRLADRLVSQKGIPEQNIRNLHGAGQLIWLRNGDVVHHEYNIRFIGKASAVDMDALKDLTLQVFGQ